MNPIIAKAGADPRRGRRLPSWKRGDRVDAQRQFAPIGKRLVGANIFRGANVVNAGHSGAARFIHCGMNHTKELFFRRRRNDAINQVHRSILEEAGGIAVSIANDGAPRRIFGLSRDARQTQCESIGHGHVSVIAAQENRSVRSQRVKPIVRR